MQRETGLEEVRRDVWDSVSATALILAAAPLIGYGNFPGAICGFSFSSLEALICAIFEGHPQKPRCFLWPMQSQTPSVLFRDSRTMIAGFQARTTYL